MNFDLNIEFGNIMIALTDRSVGNHKIGDFGLCGQKITVNKKGSTLAANLCGITVDTYYSFDKIYNFAMTLKDSVGAYANNVVVQTSYE